MISSYFEPQFCDSPLYFAPVIRLFKSAEPGFPKLTLAGRARLEAADRRFEELVRIANPGAQGI